MLEYLEFNHVGPAPHMRLDLAKRLNVLTGDNGLGKTFVLDAAWYAATDTWSGPPAAPDPSARQQPTLAYGLVDGREAARADLQLGYWLKQQTWERRGLFTFDPDMLALYARIDGGFAVWDEVRNGVPPMPNAVDPLTPPVAFQFSAAEVFDGLNDADGSPLCNGLIRDWVSWRSQRRRGSRLMEQVLATLAPAAALGDGGGEPLRPGRPVRLGAPVLDPRDIPTVRMPYGEVPVTQVSAGMRRALGLAYLLVWAWQEHLEAAKLVRSTPAKSILLLVDEIEAHLHPQWQRVILPALLKAVEVLSPAVAVQVIATTHAPLVLASMEPLFDPDQDRLFNFRLDRGQVEVEPVPFAPRGDADNWLMASDVFGLAQPRAVEQEALIAHLSEAAADESLDPDRYTKLTAQLEASSLPETDPIRTRWAALGERLGFAP